ncbi:MAG: HAD family phosphatase [Thermoclostridium sp.]|nr:HAD family phosphatase [Thermoclostridium sp.]
MNSFTGKLLVCDMDGTLLNSKREISDENKTALFDFVKHGGRFSVATGRDEVSVGRYLEELPVNLPVIVYNGAAIFDYSVNRTVWHKYLDRGVYPILTDLMMAFPDLGVEIYQENNIFVLKENSATKAQIERDFFIPCYAPMGKIPFPWKKIILAWEPEKLASVEAFLHDRQPPYRFFYSQPDFIEILNPEASKGAALKELAVKNGVSREAIIAMGDNMNDLEMLQYAGTGIAVANAHPNLLAAVNFRCGHHDSSAVAQVIRWLDDGLI